MFFFKTPVFNIRHIRPIGPTCFTLRQAQIWEISSDTHRLHYISKAPLYNIIIIVDTVLSQKRIFKHKNNIMKSTISPYCHFGMHDQGLPAARLTCAAYIDDIFSKRSYYFCIDMTQADSDWLNTNSLGTMSAFAYIENLA